MSSRETYEKRMQARLVELQAEIAELYMNIAQNTVSDSDSDELIDSSENGEPMTHLHGAQYIIQQVPREAFQDMDKVEPGMAVTAQTEQGQINLVITQVEDEMVTVDANHPLAGKSLKFSVTVEEVRDASDDEKEHGHVHGPGGHNHD